MKKRFLSGAMAGVLVLSAASQAFAGVSPIDYGADTSKYFENAADLEYLAKPGFKDFPGTQIQKHDSAYTFMLAEDEGVTDIDAKKHFIVLDEFDMQDGSGKKEYLVMTYEGYGVQKYDLEEDYGRFDPERPGNIGYRLNSPEGTFETDPQRKVGEETAAPRVSRSLMSDEGWVSEPYNENYSVTGEDGNGGFTLPKKIRDYINTEHIWQNDGYVGNLEPYTFKAGITMLSYAEMEKYWGKYGLEDGTQGLKLDNGRLAGITYGGNGDAWGNGNGEVVAWLLRTTISEVDATKVTQVSIPFGNRSTRPWGQRGAYSKKVIRPVFCLTEDFFKEVKINMSKFIGDDNICYNANAGQENFKSGLSAGPAVREIIRKYNTEEDLVALGYNQNEINLILSGMVSQVFKPHDTMGAAHVTNPDYIFQLADSDKKFVFLEEDPDTNQMFVNTYDAYGPRSYYTGSVGEHAVIDYNGEDTIYSWLNSTFLTEGNNFEGVNYKLPDGIIRHLALSTWYSEPGTPWEDPWKYSQKAEAKLSFLSTTEWRKYNKYLGARDNFGCDDNSKGSLTGWFLRSQAKPNARGNVAFVKNNIVTSSPDGNGNNVAFPIGAVCLWWYNTALLVRPCFFLDNNFVTEEKLNTETIGIKVKEYIRKYHTRNEFKALTFADGSSYSEQDIVNIFGGPIEITNVKFTDKDGNELKELSPGMTVKIVYMVNNNEEASQEMTAIIACYDNTAGTMKAAGSSGTVTVAGGEKGREITAVMKLPDNVDNLKISAYLWDSLNGMKPIRSSEKF